MSDERRPAEDDADEEIRFHIERRTESLIRGGMDPEAARGEALRRFGDVGRARQAMSRETRRRQRADAFQQRADALAQDLRYGARQLVRAPAFSLVVTLTLALAIGANTAIFSVVDHVLLRPLPFPASEQLVALWSDVTRRGGPDSEWLSYANFADVRDGLGSVETGAVWGGWSPTLTQGNEAVAVQGAIVSHEMFSQVLRVAPALGRDFLPEEDRPDAPRVVLLSDAFWRGTLGADPDVLGRTLELNGVSHEVVGVMPSGFRPPFLGDAEAWGLLQADPVRELDRRGGFSLRSVLRLVPGTTAEDAQSEAAALASRLEAAHPESNTGMGFTIRPLLGDLVRSARTGLAVVMAAVALVLIVACVNVANLVLARSHARAGEISIRAAVGAGRPRLIQQLLVESLLLAGLGGGLGVLLGWLGTGALVALAPEGTPRIDSVAMDGRVLVFSLAATLLAGLASGLLPALRAARPDLQQTLRDGGPRTLGVRGGARLRGALVSAQVALALVMLVGAGLLLQTFSHLRTVDLGYEPAGVLTFFVSLPGTRYGAVETRMQFVGDLEARLASLPGVNAVGVVESLPLSGFDGDVTFLVEGRPLPRPGEESVTWLRPATPGYMGALGLRMVAGRWLESGDVRDAPRVIVVNETLAERHFPGENPVGRRIRLGGDPSGPLWEVVGVVADTRHFSVRDDRREAAYASYGQVSPASFFVTVRGSAGSDPLALTPGVRRAIGELDGTLALRRIRAMEEVVAGSRAQERFLALLMSLFAVATLVLAIVGLYGVVAYQVSAGLREMGVRMALGAAAGRIGRAVVARSLAMAAVGVGLGVALSALAAPVLRSLLYGVGALDPATIALVALVLLGVSVLASAVPALRASRVDPVEVLRSE